MHQTIGYNSYMFRRQLKKSPEPDFYKDDNGRFVMTKYYHIKRGSCCGSKCKHCPYEPLYEKGSKTIQESLRK